jgi:hypothetical protein
MPLRSVRGRWEDFETYWSCSSWGIDDLLGKKVERNDLYKQNTFSMFWTAEALLEAYRATSKRDYLDLGERVLDELLMAQASWRLSCTSTCSEASAANADGDGTTRARAFRRDHHSLRAGASGTSTSREGSRRSDRRSS